MINRQLYKKFNAHNQVPHSQRSYRPQIAKSLSLSLPSNNLKTVQSKAKRNVERYRSVHEADHDATNRSFLLGFDPTQNRGSCSKISHNDPECKKLSKVNQPRSTIILVVPQHYLLLKYAHGLGVCSGAGGAEELFENR